MDGQCHTCYVPHCKDCYFLERLRHNSCTEPPFTRSPACRWRIQHPTYFVLHTGSGNTTRLSALWTYSTIYRYSSMGSWLMHIQTLRLNFIRVIHFMPIIVHISEVSILPICTASSKWNSFPDHLHVKLHRRLYRTSHSTKMMGVNFS
jgi:hypothetical protein